MGAISVQAWLVATVLLVAVTGSLAEMKIPEGIGRPDPELVCTSRDNCRSVEKLVDLKFGTNTFQRVDKLNEDHCRDVTYEGERIANVCPPNWGNNRGPCPRGSFSDRNACCETCRYNYLYLRTLYGSLYVVHMPWVHRYQMVDYGFCWNSGDCRGLFKRCVQQYSLQRVLVSTVPINSQWDMILAVINNNMFWTSINLPNYCKCSRQRAFPIEAARDIVRPALP